MDYPNPKHRLTWDYLGWKETYIPQNSLTQIDWNQTILTKVNQISANIYQSSLKSGANTIAMNDKCSTLFLNNEYYNSVTNSVSKYKIIIDNSIQEDIVYVYIDLIDKLDLIPIIDDKNNEISFKHISLFDLAEVENFKNKLIGVIEIKNMGENLEKYEFENTNNLEFFFNKYLETVRRKKPNIRMGEQLKLMIDITNMNYD